MEYVTVKPAWDLAERRIKQTQSIQRQQQRNRKAPTSARCADINLSSVLRRLRQEDGHKFKASLGYTAMISQPVLHSENLIITQMKDRPTDRHKEKKKSII